MFWPKIVSGFNYIDVQIIEILFLKSLCSFAGHVGVFCALSMTIAYMLNRHILAYKCFLIIVEFLTIYL